MSKVPTWLLKEGWIFALLFIGALFYLQGMQKKKEIRLDLEASVQEWEREKTVLKETQDELTSQIASQEDPEWIELTLMKGLGVVPEGQTKVYFEKKEEESSP